MDNGAIFTYKNDFGGEWSEDPKKPFQGGGRAQAWSPSIGRNETWTWGKDIIRGVNLGGWLVTEPFVSPALYEKYVNKTDIYVADEWTLCLAMGADGAEELEGHYKTFITERDFAEIAAAGLNWVRIPIGFWAIEAINDEPFLVGTSWGYFLKAVEWARKYGIRIYLDLHSLPGSQNGWNHSGRMGAVNFMHGTMGLANAQRTLTYLRILVEFVSQAQYREVVPIVGIVNEILWSAIGETGVKSWYQVAYDTIRESTGMGEGPYIVVHDGFQGPPKFEGFMEGADRLILDQHPVSISATNEMAIAYTIVQYIAFQNDHTSSDWAIATNQSSKVFGITLGGEFSAAINDCGYWLSGIGSVPGYPDCGPFDDWHNYNDTMKGVLNDMALASMDALQNWFFWTWKIGNSTTLGTSSSPMWHYKLGLQEGWIPKDPRSAIGHCAAKLGKTQEFDGNYPASATGQGNGTLASTVDFPPHTMEPSFTGTQIALLPTYTPTGTVHSLFGPTFTAAPSAVVGTGWNNTADTQLAYVPVSGCAYPDAWNATDAPLPAATCTGS
ncbi:glycoside hydrolase family 5 protein [Schizophyllum commune]